MHAVSTSLRLTATALLSLLALLLTPVSASPSASLPSALADEPVLPEEPVAVPIRFGDDLVQEPLMAVSVMPGETVPLAIPGAASRRSSTPFRVTASAGTVERPGRTWRYRAPEMPGTATLTVQNVASGARTQLHVFVLTLYDHKASSLDGYRIGRYQAKRRRGLSSYERPRGFVRVTKENKDLPVSPNFVLSQFLCKQTSTTPQFALIDTRLIQVLEDVLAGVQAQGHDVETLHVMSAFRTPFYNRSIGNKTVYSRHLYGDAADIFVDADEDSWMDDLNGDGRVTKADARVLAGIINDVAGKNGSFDGGLGTYGPASHRGPFVHLDLRGYKARW
jgi:hypothetical protein